MIFTLFNLRRINTSYHKNLVFVFVLMLIFNSFVGFLNNANISSLFDDVRYLSYFPMLLFFSLSINSLEKVKNVTNIIKFSSLTVCIVYSVVCFFLRSGMIDSSKFYESMTPYDGVDIAFRSEYIFIYTGLFIGFSSFFLFLFDGEVKYKSKRHKIVRLFSLLTIAHSVFITYTRGLLISVFTTAITSYLYLNYKNQKAFLNIIFIAALFVFSMIFAGDIITDFSGVRSSNQDDSDLVRVVSIEQLLNMLTPLSLLIGHGLGIGVQIRPSHMEIVYLEILHKQGIVGISFYLFLLVKIIINLFSIFRSKNCGGEHGNIKSYALSYTSASLYVYIQSFTNPLLTNALGTSIVVLSLTITDLLVYLQSQRQDSIRSTCSVVS